MFALHWQLRSSCLYSSTFLCISTPTIMHRYLLTQGTVYVPVGTVCIKEVMDEEGRCVLTSHRKVQINLFQHGKKHRNPSFPHSIFWKFIYEFNHVTIIVP